MDWLDMGLWYNWIKGVPLCDQKKFHSIHHSVPSSGQPRSTQPTVPCFGWRAIFSTPVLESMGGPETSLSPQMPTQVSVISLRPQITSHDGAWARAVEAVASLAPAATQGAAHKIRGQQDLQHSAGTFWRACVNLHSALDTAPHLPAEAPVQALSTTCLPAPKVGFLGTSTTLCWVWQ